MKHDIPPTRMARFALWLHDWLFELAARLANYTVSFPWDAAIQWPRVCTRCGECLPDRTWPVRIARSGHWSMLVGLEPPWRRRRLDIPVCRACHRRAWRQTWLGRVVPLVTLLAILLSGLAISTWLAAGSPGLAVLVRIGAVFGSISAGIAVGLAIGTPFDITVGKHKTIDFAFKSRDRAQALADANQLEVIEPDPLPSSEL